MYISNIFGLIATTSLLGIASAGCFSSGAKWTDIGGTGTAKEKLDIVCLKLQGVYKKDQEVPECASIGTDARIDFKIKYIGKDDGYRELSSRECKDGLSKEITGCDRGGKTGYKNWEYTADPAGDGDCK